MAWGGGSSFSFGSFYRFLSSSIAAELKLDLSRVDQVITAANGEPRGAFGGHNLPYSWPLGAPTRLCSGL